MINIAKSDIKYNKSIGCDTSYEEQLAEWLEELKTYMALKKSNFLSGYDKAIDDFAELLREKRDKRTMKVGCDDLELRKIKEQLKAGGEE